MYKLLAILVGLGLVPVASAQTKMEMLTTSDGAELAYVDEGNPRLGTIVFVHGGPGYHSAYLRGLAVRLREDFRTILYDQRASGQSSRAVPDSSITLKRFVEDLHELLQNREATNVILLGQSFGGAIVLEYVFAYPGQVARVILANGLVDARMAMEDRIAGASAFSEQRDIPEVKAVVTKYMQGRKLNFEDLIVLADDPVQELYWYDQDAPGVEFIEGGSSAWGYTTKTGPTVEKIVRIFFDSGVLLTYSALDRLQEIHQPVLVVTGSHDQVISPRQAREAAKRLSRSRLEIIEKAGHYVHIEAREEYQELIYEFSMQQFD